MASHTSGVKTRCDNLSGVTTIGFLRVEELLDRLLHDGNSGATFANHTIMIIDPRKLANEQETDHKNMVPAQYRVSSTQTNTSSP